MKHTDTSKTQRNIAGIVRGQWSRNEQEYLTKALEFYDEAFYINPADVTYRFERESGIAIIEYNGRVLNNLSMLYSFGYGEPTLLLVKSLMSIGCPISDSYHAISRDCLGKISAALDFLPIQSGTTTHLISSYPAAQDYFARLDDAHFPLLNKPFKGNQGRGIVALDNRKAALKFARKHFERDQQFLMLEKQMTYAREWRVYSIDGELIDAYEKQKVEGKIVANLHQGARSLSVDPAVKAELFAFVREHIPPGYEIGVYGLDLALTDTGNYHVIEINRTPGFRGFNALTGNSLPRLIHERLIKRAQVQSIPAQPVHILTFLGETSFGERYQQLHEDKGQENILKTRGYDYCIENFKAIIANSDYTIANLEVALTSLRESPLQKHKPFVDWGDPIATPELLKRVGVHAVSLGNNHTMDFGPDGLVESLQALQHADIASFGAGLNAAQASEPLHHYVDLGDEEPLHIIIAAGFEYRSTHVAWDYYANLRDSDQVGVNLWTKSSARRQIRQLRKTYPKAFIIAYPHWGNNYEFKIERQERLVASLLAGGADLIIGHGSHVLSEVERHDGKWVLYGTGNFVFNSIGRFKKMGKNGFGIVVRLYIYRDKTMWLRLYPIFTDNRTTNYQSRFVTLPEFEKIINFLMPYKADLQTALEQHFSVGSDEYGLFMTCKVR